ncbi:hypothetical protein [Sphingomonas sp. SRS2]|uniref:hypothetical protein n=1 Tax=Sphingomonas sp. SRS2 TaxID=133190 RepID=UPI0006183F3E|nr:hypothetical protein [Sphingomonas sp. SRS2]KKC25796.1 hypothetical protein WP12_12120 [Sphingomonas sp. SRS2]
MAFTYERKIDALGGNDTIQSEDWNEGYAAALSMATEIGADADYMIEELIETIDAILYPRREETLVRWAAGADLLLTRIRARQA